MKDVILQKKQQRIVAIVIFVIYGLALIVGFLGYFTHILDGLFANFEISYNMTVEKTSIMVKAFSFLLFVTTPSLLIYLAAKNPYQLPTWLRVLLYLLGMALMAVLTYVYFLVIVDKYGEISSPKEMPYSPKDGDVYSYTVNNLIRTAPILATVIIPILYAVSFIKLKSNITFKPSSKEWANKLKRILAKILLSYVSYLHTNIRCVLISLFVTFLAMLTATIFFAMLSFALYLIMVIWLLLAMGLLWLNVISRGMADEPTYKVNDDGERTLTRSGTIYIDGSPHDEYKDDKGNAWISDDGGKSFYKE